MATKVGMRETPRIPRIQWCCTCDKPLGKEMDPPENIGPHHHLTAHPDHYVIEVTGELYVWRNRPGEGNEP